MTAVTQSAPTHATDNERLRADLLRAWPKISLRLSAAVLLLVLLFSWALEGTDASPGELVRGIPNIVNFLKHMFPPEWDTQKQTLQTPEIGLSFGLTIPRIGLESVTFPMPTIVYAILETLQMAIIGTTLG